MHAWLGVLFPLDPPIEILIRHATSRFPGQAGLVFVGTQVITEIMRYTTFSRGDHHNRSIARWHSYYFLFHKALQFKVSGSMFRARASNPRPTSLCCLFVMSGIRQTRRDSISHYSIALQSAITIMLLVRHLKLNQSTGCNSGLQDCVIRSDIARFSRFIYLMLLCGYSVSRFFLWS